MKAINAEECIKLIQETFPKFLPYWQSYIEYWGEDMGLINELMPFGDLAADVIKADDVAGIKKIFDFVEFLLHKGDDYVQTAMTTGFLEDLMHRDPDEIQFSKFAQYIGKESREYCKAWDEFTGVRTKGLWENE